MKIQKGRTFLWTISAALGLGITAPLMADELFTVVAKVAVTNKGVVFTNADGRTLYTFDKDTSDQSNCSSTCLVNWPAAVVPPETVVTGSFGTVKTANGALQLTFNHHPLYTYISDTDPGDTYGENVGKVWHLARP